MKATLARRVLGVMTLALAFSPAVHATPPATSALAWPAYANVIITGSTPDRAPQWRIETVEARDPSGIADVSAEWSCDTKWAPAQSFDVFCRPINQPRPIVLGNQVVNRAWNCANPAVRAEIAGPMQGESVTGTVRCMGSAATCTASATTPSLAAGGYHGLCVQNAPSSPPPVWCSADLSKVFLDRWEVTCYTSDP